LKVPFGSLPGVSESSPVAEAIQGFNPCNSLDAGRARELQKCAQPATQMLSVHCLYQSLSKSASPNRFFRGIVYPTGSGGFSLRAFEKSQVCQSTVFGDYVQLRFDIAQRVGTAKPIPTPEVRLFRILVLCLVDGGRGQFEELRDNSLDGMC
jgi:hypothetical protein